MANIYSLRIEELVYTELNVKAETLVEALEIATELYGNNDLEELTPESTGDIHYINPYNSEEADAWIKANPDGKFFE